jgi:PBP1b-binding outer membrane lipoprotein LpoB
MKNIYRLVLLCFVICTGCLDEEEPFAKQVKAPGQILFTVPTENLLTAQATMIQPNFSLIAGRFNRAGNMNLTVTLPAELTNLDVNLVVTATGVRQPRASFTGLNGTASVSLPMNTIGANNAPVTTGTVVLEFLAYNADGSVTVRRMFSATGF